ncbi:TPM domain-containing protein [Catellatospora paridis]|uniref:TPM domain-containing protein n=1 Tax=Catellatospora paridis TaxID=1617086 RepID=UPI0012D3A27F|nr:TPM domain-containing protein [Catellatospora paridis]
MPVQTSEVDLFSVLCCLAIIVLGVVLALTVAGRRRRRDAGTAKATPQQAGPVDPFAAYSTVQLSTYANGQLVAVDNAVRTSEQELGFATAQYGAEAVTAFATAVASAKEDLAAAFRIRHQLDDEIPEDDTTRRQLLREIVDRCGAVDRRLDAEADAFEKLRAMGANAEELGQSLLARAGELRDRLPGAQATLARLTDRYTDGALTPVAGNVTEAVARLDFADEQLRQSAAGLAAGDRGKAALALRGAEQALGQAGSLLDALDKSAADLDTAGQNVTRLVDEMQGEVAAGKAAMQAAGGAGGADQMNLAAAVARADQVAGDVRTQLGKPQTDPLGMMRRLEGAASGLAEAMGGVRDAANRTEQARRQLDQALHAARAAVDSATGYITTRRGAVGTTARARLSEAHALLDRAESGGDPVDALAAAERAHDLAAQAMDSARDDIERWSFPSGYSGQAGGGRVIIGGPGGFGTAAAGGMGGAVLGGILLDSVLGGGGMGGFRIGLTSEASQSDGSATTPGAPPVQGRFGGPSTWMRPEKR